MQSRLTSRRTFLKQTMLGIGATSVVQLPAWGQGPLRVRQDIGKLERNHPIVGSYAKAIQVMMGRPANDPTSWQSQAEIHQNNCPHGNWFFLPWHRAYLYRFEEICREAAGDKNFTLPYWNWTRDAQLPAAFWGSSNPLNHARGIGPDDSMPPEFVGSVVVEDRILNLPDFEVFASRKAVRQRDRTGSGELEATPHDNVHGIVGGVCCDMGTYMSPLDPIFWLHHANVDRLWAQWNDNGFPNTTDPDWLKFKFVQNFVTPDRKKVDVSVSQLTTTQALGYRYDTQPEAGRGTLVRRSTRFSEAVNSLETVTNTTPTRARQPIDIKLTPGKSVLEKYNLVARPLTLAASPAKALAVAPTVVRLTIDQVTPPKDPTVFVRVFLNCDYLSVATPINDPHYVASFGFFQPRGDHGDHGDAAYVFDLTRTLQRLQRAGRVPTDDLRVQLLAIPRREGSEADVEVVAKRVQVTVLSNWKSGE